jgi:hypothetical protein
MTSARIGEFRGPVCNASSAPPTGHPNRGRETGDTSVLELRSSMAGVTKHDKEDVDGRGRHRQGVSAGSLTDSKHAPSQEWPNNRITTTKRS